MAQALLFFRVSIVRANVKNQRQQQHQEMCAWRRVLGCCCCCRRSGPPAVIFGTPGAARYRLRGFVFLGFGVCCRCCSSVFSLYAGRRRGGVGTNTSGSELVEVADIFAAVTRFISGRQFLFFSFFPRFPVTPLPLPLHHHYHYHYRHRYHSLALVYCSKCF